MQSVVRISISRKRSLINLDLVEVGRTISLWPLNILRDGPKRGGRLAAVLSINPISRDLRKLGAWWLSLITYMFDLFGGPEIIQVLIRLAVNTRRLSDSEQRIAWEVIGQDNLRYDDIRIANGGLLRLVFKLNKGRAFAAWHTLSIPTSSEQRKSLLVHELVHTYQYEKRGSIYIGQGLWAQLRQGRKAYSYGGGQGLAAHFADGKRFSDFNREQQGQIAEDYSELRLSDLDTKPYDPYIDDLRTGVI